MERDAGDWSDLLGAAEQELEERLGAPSSRRATSGDAWLTFVAPAGRLRVRCADDGSGTRRVASWVLTFADPRDTLAAATGTVGLWPAAAPDAVAREVAEPLVRRAVRDPRRTDRLLSLTATVRGGRFDRLSMFDEPPDWR